MPTRALTEIEREYLTLATEAEREQKLIHELESPFSYQRSPDTQRAHDHMLADARTRLGAYQRRMAELKPLFDVDQAQRFAFDLADTAHGKITAKKRPRSRDR